MVLLVATAGTASLGWHVGWLQAPEAWPQATGWHRLDPQPDPSSHFEISDLEAIELSWLGHAGFLLEWADTRILLDPNTSSRCTLASRVLEPALPAAELGTIDAALISHAHYDHLDLPTLRSLPELGRIVLPEGAGRYVAELASRGIDVVEMVAEEHLRVGEIEVIAIRARHNGNRLHPLQSQEGALGYLLRHREQSIFFAGDSGYGNHFREIGERFRPRLALLPIGAYAPRFPMRYYHLSPEEAVTAALDLGAETVVPMHFGTFALALDRPSSALPRFAAAAETASLAWAMPSLLSERPRSEPQPGA